MDTVSIKKQIEKELHFSIDELQRDEIGRIVKTDHFVYDFMKANVRDMSIFTEDTGPNVLISFLSKNDRYELERHENLIDIYNLVKLYEYRESMNV